jgi:hypothetical protein
MDPESQFYPPISLDLSGNEDTTLIRYFRIISFYEESQYPPVLSSLWTVKCSWKK